MAQQQKLEVLVAVGSLMAEAWSYLELTSMDVSKRWVWNVLEVVADWQQKLEVCKSSAGPAGPATSQMTSDPVTELDPTLFL